MAQLTNQDDFIKTALRLPRDVHENIQKVATENGRSMNAEIVARLQQSLDGTNELPGLVQGLVKEEAERRGISPQEALERLVLAGGQPGAPAVLFVRAEPGMTLEQYRVLFEAAKEFTPPDSPIVLDGTGKP